MPEPYGIYEGTIGEREYAHGFNEGSAAAEYDARHYPATVWNTMACISGQVPALMYRDRAFWLGWLRGYREVVR